MLLSPSGASAKTLEKARPNSPQRENGLGAPCGPSCTARAGYGFATLCLDSSFPMASKGCGSMAVSTWRAQRNEKARARLMRNLPEVFPGAVLVHALSRPFLPQRRDGQSIRIGATTRSGPINSLARSLPLAARRKDGCGESESRNLGHGSVFGRPQPRFANRPLRRAPAIAVCAGSPYFGSAGIATFGATAAQIVTLHGTVVASRLGTYGLRRATMSGT